MNKIILRAAGFALALAALAPIPALADSFDVRVVGNGMSFGFDTGTPALPPVPIAPAPQRVWMPGYWAWNGYRQVWVEGRWVLQQPAVIITQPVYPRPPAWSFGWRDERRDWDRHDGWAPEHRHHGWRGDR